MGKKTLSIFEQMAPNETHFVHAPVRALPCLVWGHWHKNGPDVLPIGGNEHYWLASRDLCGSQYLQTEVPWQATVPYFATPPYVIDKQGCRLVGRVADWEAGLQAGKQGCRLVSRAAGW